MPVNIFMMTRPDKYNNNYNDYDDYDNYDDNDDYGDYNDFDNDYDVLNVT